MQSDLHDHRLGEKIHSPGGENLRFGIGVIVAGQEHHRQIFTTLDAAEPRHDLQAVHAGHVQIEQHKVGLLLFHLRESLRPGGNAAHVVTNAEQGLDGQQNDLVVVHRQDRVLLFYEQRLPYSGVKLFRKRRFVDEIQRAEPDCFRHIRHMRRGSQENRPDTADLLYLADACQRLDPAHILHHDIEHQQVVRLALQKRNRFPAVCRRRNVVMHFRQHHFSHHQTDLVVIHQKNSCHMLTFFNCLHIIISRKKFSLNIHCILRRI